MAEFDLKLARLNYEEATSWANEGKPNGYELLRKGLKEALLEIERLQKPKRRRSKRRKPRITADAS